MHHKNVWKRGVVTCCDKSNDPTTKQHCLLKTNKYVGDIKAQFEVAIRINKHNE